MASVSGHSQPASRPTDQAGGRREAMVGENPLQDARARCVSSSVRGKSIFLFVILES